MENPGSHAVWAVGTIGGLHMVIINKNGKSEVVGAAPHPGVARFVAHKKEPDIVFNLLEKSETIDPSLFSDKIDQYVTLTNKINAIYQG